MKHRFGTLLALATSLIVSGPALAGIVQLASSSGLSAGDTTLNFPGTIGFAFNGPYSAGTNRLTFTSAGGILETDQVGNNYFNSGFSNGTIILYAAGFTGATAPITIDFASAIAEVGFNAEEYQLGSYTMFITAFDGAINLGTFKASGNDPDTLSFLGLQTFGGDGITSLAISDNNGNNIALGPITFGGSPAAVPEPEACAMMAAGLGLLGWSGRRKKQ